MRFTICDLRLGLEFVAGKLKRIAHLGGEREGRWRAVGGVEEAEGDGIQIVA